MKYFSIILSILMILSCAKKPPVKTVASPPDTKPSPSIARHAIDPNEEMFSFTDGDGFPEDKMYFPLNSDVMIAPYYPDRLGEWMRNHLDASVLLIGHACPLGEEDYNYELGGRRAVSVKNYLVSRYKIDRNRIFITSKGESEPVTDEPTEYQLNRRVEVTREWKR